MIYFSKMPLKDTKEIWIKKARKVYGDKFDYSKVHYVNSRTKITIICPIHGEFCVTPKHHLRRNCYYCGKKKQSTEEWIKKAQLIHGSQYDYSESKYVNYYTKIRIKCYLHGTFELRSYQHIQKKMGCCKCHPKQKPLKPIFKFTKCKGIVCII